MQKMKPITKAFNELWPDMQKVYFCPGTDFWPQKCPDNSFGNIFKIYGCESQYQGVLVMNIAKLVFISTWFSQYLSKIFTNCLESFDF